MPLSESPARETTSPEAARPAGREVSADPVTPAAVPASTPSLGTANAPVHPVVGEGTEQAGEVAPANAESTNEEPSAADAPGAGLALAMLPFDLVALDRAVDDLLNGLQDAGRALDEAVGGVGSAPWLAMLAAVVTTYEATRRRRDQSKRAADALVAALPEARS